MADNPLLHEKLTTGSEFLGGTDYYQKIFLTASPAT